MKKREGEEEREGGLEGKKRGEEGERKEKCLGR